VRNDPKSQDSVASFLSNERFLVVIGREMRRGS